MEFQLPQGTGDIKHTRPYRSLTPNQKLVYDLCYDEINGPLFFAENCCYVNRNGLEHYVPFDYQREMIFNMHNYKRLISLFSRQNGKTITSAIYLLWFAMKYDHKDILICAQSKEASMENLSKIKMAYEYCPDFLKRGLVSDNKSTLEFDNGSRIAVRAANIKAPRGLSPAIVYVDEFAFIGSQDSADKALELQQEFYAALTPSLSATGGKLFITSTPISETDMFYRIWSGSQKKVDDKGMDLKPSYILDSKNGLYRDFHLFESKRAAQAYVASYTGEEKFKVVAKEPVGNNGFQGQLVKWDKNPFKTKEWAEEEIKNVGMEFFAREYNCVSGDTMVEIMDNKGEIRKVSLKMLAEFY
jgi:hypothetical protein